MRRVVVTGMGAISPFGSGVAPLFEALCAGQSGVRVLPELSSVGGLRSLVAGPVPDLDPKQIPRKFRRSTRNWTTTLGSSRPPRCSSRPRAFFRTRAKVPTGTCIIRW